MKTTALSTWTAVCLSVLTASVVFRASADQAATAVKPDQDKTHTGMVTAIDPQEHVLRIRDWTLLPHSFTLGDSCAFTLLDNKPGSLNDLHRGMKIQVAYQNAHGVLVADRVEQLPMRREGTVQAIDPANHTLTLRQRGMDRQFQLADDTRVMLRGDKSGALTDIKPGHYVTVLFETPGGKPLAREIAQTSETFSGSLTAIDLPDQTVKARGLFGSKKFNVGNNCAVVLNGRMDAKLADLKPGDRLVFSYDAIDGVNVVNRIAAEPVQPQNMTVQVAPTY